MSETNRAILACAAAAAAIGAAAQAGNLLTNASFETVGPWGPHTEYTGYSGGGHSAALGWGVFNNEKGTTITDLVDSTLPQGGEKMLYVRTDGIHNGVSQVFLPYNEGPPCVLSGVWVYVVSGRILIGAGNGGNTGPNVYSTTTGEWEHIEGENLVCPANTYIIYSGSAGGAEFYVDLASVEEFACEGPAADLDQDGFVTFADLLLLLNQWGQCPPKGECPADLDGDRVVGFTDLLLLLHVWGTC